MLGSGPPDIRPDDRVCVLYGGHFPLILRQDGKLNQYKLIGECFVDGLMYGEGMDMGLESRDFLLV